MQYFSENIAKVMVDLQMSGNIRARGKNARFCGETCRIFTSNALSLEQWFGSRCHWSAPLQRKCWVFIVDALLVKVGWSSDPSYVRGEM